MRNLTIKLFLFLSFACVNGCEAKFQISSTRSDTAKDDNEVSPEKNSEPVDAPDTLDKINTADVPDILAPKVTFSSLSAPKVNAAIIVNIAFSEPIVGFELDDLEIKNASTANFKSIDSSNFSLELEAVLTGEFGISLAAGMVHDAAGNANLEAPPFRRTLNAQPKLTFIEPNDNNDYVALGSGFAVSWTDEDIDDDAQISLFAKITPTGPCANGSLLATGIAEDSAVNSQVIDASSLPLGSWHVCATIDDGIDSLDNWSTSAIEVVNPPAATSVTTTKADGSYTLGEVIDLKMTFNESVTVTGGTPELPLNIGIINRTASYMSGSPGTELMFRYTVSQNDVSSDLDVHATNLLNLAGASIKSTATGIDASRVIPISSDPGALANSSAIVIDALPPTLTNSALTIGTQDVTTTTIRVHWNLATDNLTAVNNLQYKLVYSTVDNISSLADARDNGSVVMAYTANVQTATLAALTANTSYFFNVIVKDALGNESVYVKMARTTESFCGGIGTLGNPYQVCTLGDLHSMRDIPNGFFILNNDIDASETITWNGNAGWVPIGSNTIPFTGGLNGNFKKIKSLTINRPTENDVGFFGYVSSSNTFENTGFLDVSISGKNSVGGFIGRFSGSGSPKVQQSYTTGAIVGAPDTIYRGTGGLIGTSSGVAISSCFSTASVTDQTGNRNTGGLIGAFNGTSISFSYATGKVTSLSGMRGGLVGWSTGAISHSFATGDVVSGNDSFSGGLVGWSYTLSSLSYSFATGNVYSTGQTVGGLVGSMGVNLSYGLATGHVHGTWYTGGLIGATAAATPDYSYSLATGKNLSTNGARGALVSGPAAAGSFTVTKSYAYDWANGLTCKSSGSDANCALVTTGTVKPFAFRYSKEIEYVQMKYAGSPSIALRKISDLDQAAYRIAGSCTVHGATINLVATDGSDSVSATTTCSAYSWQIDLNLSSLSDGAVIVTADQAGSFSKTLNLTKETSFCAADPTSGDFAGGNGTVGTPFLICTATQFDKIRNYLAAGTFFRLMNAVDLSRDFSGPIGSDSAGNCTSRFCGVLDGNGHTVKNVFIIAPTSTNVGLFGATDDANSKIENLGVENIHIIGSNTVGAIVGLGSKVNLSNVYAQGNILRGSSPTAGYVGGLVGHADGNSVITGTMANINLAVDSVTSGSDIGGIVGRMGSSGTTVVLTKNESWGVIIANNSSGYVGGLVGYNDAQSAFENAAHSHILSSNNSNDGGFTGRISRSITNSIADGSLLKSGTGSTGGFVGRISGNGRFVTSSLTAGHVIATQARVGGVAGGLSVNTDIKLIDVVGVGHTYSTSLEHGTLVGRIDNQSGNQVVNSFFWNHSGVTAACVGDDQNITDTDTCNDVNLGLNYSLLSTFTSASAVYANWDFTNTWTFSSAGRLPQLKWQYEP